MIKKKKEEIKWDNSKELTKRVKEFHELKSPKIEVRKSFIQHNKADVLNLKLKMKNRK